MLCFSVAAEQKNHFDITSRNGEISYCIAGTEFAGF